MQVQSNYSVQNNYNPKFKSIKSIRGEGLYKKHPEYVNNLVTALKRNDTAMDFCKKYDVNIVFHAAKEGYNNLIKSTIVIFYDNPALSKLKKFWNSISSNESKVSVFALGSEFREGECTENLIKSILPAKEGNGLLDSHINYENRQIKDALDKKMARKNKISSQKDKKDMLAKKEADKENLDKNILDLIEMTKQ